MKLRINIDGKQYEADIEIIEEERVEPAAATRAPRPKTAGATGPREAPAGPEIPSSAGGGNACKSTIVGIVVKVLVTEGQAVKKGEPVIVLEAMKMESNVNAPIDGKVSKIHVAPGDSVKKGQVLVEFA